MGGETSGVKSGMASVMGAVQGMTTKLAKDELIKNTLHDYGTEHFEIACYTSLIAAAENLGDQETARVRREILRDEQAMADFFPADPADHHRDAPDGARDGQPLSLAGDGAGGDPALRSDTHVRRWRYPRAIRRETA